MNAIKKIGVIIVRTPITVDLSFISGVIFIIFSIILTLLTGELRFLRLLIPGVMFILTAIFFLYLKLKIDQPVKNSITRN